MDMKTIYMIIRYVLVAAGLFLLYRAYGNIPEPFTKTIYCSGGMALLLVCALLGTPVIGKKGAHDASDHLKYLIVAIIAIIIIVVAGIII